jgi:DNA polymerase V
LSSMSIDYLGHIDAPGHPLPLYSFTVPAGFPSPAQDHIEREISLDELLGLRLPQVFLARVGGDSMKGVGIFDGDLVVVDRAIEAKPGLIVIAALNNEPLIKTLCKDGDQFILRSENATFAPRYVLENDELLIWGVVLYSIRSHTNARA